MGIESVSDGFTASIIAPAQSWEGGTIAGADNANQDQSASTSPESSTNEPAAYVKISGRSPAKSKQDTASSAAKTDVSGTSNDGTTSTPAAAKSAGSKQARATTGASQKSSSKDQEKQRKIDELKERDTHVKAHEQAHLAALGAYSKGGPSFEYETGPDGHQYAVGGEVPVDLSEGKTPAETISKAQTIERAALAPSDPSGADRQVAAEASRMEAKARSESAKQGSNTAQAGNRSGTTGQSNSTGSGGTGNGTAGQEGETAQASSGTNQSGKPTATKSSLSSPGTTAVTSTACPHGAGPNCPYCSSENQKQQAAARLASVVSMSA